MAIPILAMGASAYPVEDKPVGILALGAESSGTKLLTRLLVMGGAQGDDNHIQTFDHLDALPQAKDKPLVWRRSLPHAHQWPDLDDMAQRIRAAGYRPVVCLIIRDMVPMGVSQVARSHVDSETEAYWNVPRALRIAMDFAVENALEFSWLTYAGLMVRPAQTIDWLYEKYGLDRSMVLDASDTVKDRDTDRWAQWRSR